MVLLELPPRVVSMVEVLVTMTGGRVEHDAVIDSTMVVL
jgi:hypothetical protein